MPFKSDKDKPRSTRYTYLVGLGLLGLAGCVPADAGYEVDPLTGGPAIPQNKAVAPPPAAAASANSLPNLPASQVSSGPAALAGGVTVSVNPPSPDASLNLRISGTAVSQTNNDNWKPPAGTVIGPDPLVTSSNPAAVRLQVPTTVVANTVPIPSIPGSAVRLDTYQQVQDQLTARGVVSQQLRQVGTNGVWEFRCSVPDPRNPGINNVHVVSAPGESGVAAMRLVIQEIDAQHQQ